MDKNELKTDLQGFFDKLKALEERARKLANQNLADIAASAHGKIKQLIEHPDTHLMADTHKDQQLNPDGTPRTDRPWGTLSQDGTPITGREIHSRERGINANWVALSQAERDQYDERARAETQARDKNRTQGGNTDDKNRTFRPGDPQFDPRNSDFRDPNNVELNRDGTLRQAPNTFGTKPDVR